MLWTFSAILFIKLRFGRVIKIIFRTSMSGKAPGFNWSIFITFLSRSSVYLETKPIGPDSDSSQMIAWIWYEKCYLLRIKDDFIEITLVPSHLSNISMSSLLAASWTSDTLTHNPCKCGNIFDSHQIKTPNKNFTLMLFFSVFSQLTIHRFVFCFDIFHPNLETSNW